MTFASGAKKLWEIIDDMAAGLIAAPGGYWTDGDATWTTTDKTGNNARLCLHYLNGSEELYIALEQINQSSGAQYYYGNNAWRYGKGLRITVSAIWDSVNHIYPSSNQSTFIPFEARYNGGVSGDLAVLQITYYLWFEPNGFVLMGKPEPKSTDDYQQSFIAVVERNPNKEYSDGFTNFYVFANMNLGAGGIGTMYYDGNWVGTSWRCRPILRPFAYQFPNDTSYTTYNGNGNGISFVPTPSYYAFKSSGNGKAYYVQPIVHNLASQLAPIFQSQLWFPWSETVGLIDGDVIAIEGQTTKFLCKALDSPDSVNRLNFAIKYVA